MTRSYNHIIIVDQNIIQIDDYRIVLFLGQSFVDVTLEIGQYIKKAKKYYLILKIIILDPQGRFLLIFLQILIWW